MTSDDEQRLRRRLRFEEVADRYADVRPDYPEAAKVSPWLTAR